MFFFHLNTQAIYSVHYPLVSPFPVDEILVLTLLVKQTE